MVFVLIFMPLIRKLSRVARSPEIRLLLKGERSRLTMGMEIPDLELV